MQRTVMVVGASRGIGAAITRAFVKEGHRVAATCRGGAVPDGAFPVSCDVSDPAAVDAAFTAVEQHFGPVEILVVNAGVTDDGLLMRMGEEKFHRVLDTNLTGAWRCARRAAGRMARGRWGRMVFISSVAALHGSAGQTNYAASKAGLVGLARSIARELGPRNVTANVVAPGFIDTDMTADLRPDIRDEHLRGVPAGRAGTAEEVAGVVTWLAGAGYVTGAVVPVDGGLGMGH